MAQVATALSVGAGIGPILGGALTQLMGGQLAFSMLLASGLNAIALILVLLLMSETSKRKGCGNTN